MNKQHEARHSCLDCVRKHLAQASIMLDESKLGYPHHKWFAVGHLAEAESESLREFPELAVKIRNLRMCILGTLTSFNKDDICTIEDMIIYVCVIAGDYDKVDQSLNSKKFDVRTNLLDEPFLAELNKTLGEIK
jgi:hypothetical protein